MISTTCLLFFLLYGSTDTLLTSDRHNTVPGNMNPAYIVTLDSIIDPLEYGEPFAVLCGIARIGMSTFFINTDSEDYWRLVILFKDKIVVLQDHEPRLRQYALDQSQRFIYTSDNGSVITSDTPCSPHTQTRITCVNLENANMNEFMFPDDLMTEFSDIINGYHISNNDSVLSYIPLNSEISISYHSLSQLGSVDTLIYTDLENDINSYYSSSDIIQFDDNHEISSIVIDDLNSIVAEIDNPWFLTHCIGRHGFAIGELGNYVLISTSNGIICYDCSNGQPILTGLFGLETKNPMISPNETMWIVEARPIVRYPQTCPSCFIIGNFMKPLESSVAYISSGGYWSDSRVLDISDNGRLLLVKSPTRNSRIFTLLEPDGDMIWQSDTLFLFDGEHQLTHNYRTRATAALSSDGSRVIFSDFSRVYLIAIE